MAELELYAAGAARETRCVAWGKALQRKRATKRDNGQRPSETIIAMANIYYAVPPGPDRNSYWAGLNKRMGIDLKLQMVSNADYIQKFATTIAGNELPDLLQIRTSQLSQKNGRQKYRFWYITT